MYKGIQYLYQATNLIFIICNKMFVCILFDLSVKWWKYKTVTTKHQEDTPIASLMFQDAYQQKAPLLGLIYITIHWSES